MPRPHTPGPEAEPLLVDAETDLRPTPEVTAARRTLRAHPALLLVGIVLASLNMRAALAGVSPLLGEISGHFGLSATTGSLVTTIPLIFMGLASPFAPRLARRWGTEAVLLSALVLLLGGILLRVAPPVMALFAGGALVGSGIAFLNVLMPGLVKRDFPHRAAGMTALYTTSMIGGATVSAASAVPLENALGGWRGSLASWSLLAAVAALVWIPQTVLARRGTHHGEPAATPVRTTPARTAPDAGSRLSRSTLAWQVTLFMGLQSSIAYVCIAWMPTIFTDHGMSKSAAGLVFAFSTMLQMVGSFVVPTLAGRMRSQRTLAVAVAALMGAGIAGLLVAPVAGAWVWAALIGVGQGGSVGLALTMMVLRTGDAHTSARLSGMAQTWGYLLAAVGPLALGVVHQTTGGWALPLTLMLAVCGALAVLGLGAGRDRRIRS
ncbi:CynX/NimT family MFS transporter [Streptomyces rapamycinicus]|uniref:MFS transporter n=2 Tax=Streptomyces rapamycinicus TaxID=1226757 RepID=A0A0A0NQ87_STRRN|nr:MFS transporter [Streptomyces rapamycinicus]AGP56590.1 MFS transporter [Streptomyces rapamycinicus NRRL 5491]MBB4784199.1 CP family cyanate transporter-like MFS transporter [Streptomyces rapamycinicus]RLV80318.1 MFS transporter [Streptomyces rapamycinicus NRRL 5491]UTO64531.1 MFS transporter [Streptomyces rapamycinicus]UTP32487.1 MFS transporter [Streptomyces rapamycinicus NRRL 5491]